MSLRSQAAVDNKAFLNEDGDPITLIAPDTDATEHDVVGQVMRTDAQVDPDTGTQFYEPKTAVTISITDLPTGFDNTWTVRTTDSTGTTITGHIAESRYDRTINQVTLILEVFD